MAIYRETAGNITLPVVILQNVVAYPSSNIAFDIQDKLSREAVGEAMKADRLVLLLPVDSPSEFNKILAARPLDITDFFKVGTLASIINASKLAGEDEYSRVVFAGKHRVEVTELTKCDSYYMCRGIVKDVLSDDTESVQAEALVISIRSDVKQIAAALSHGIDDLLNTIEKVNDPGTVSDIVASSGIIASYEDRRDILECFEPLERAELLLDALDKQINLMQYGESIIKKTQKKLSKAQKDYFLREQINVIRDELGEGADSSDELLERIENADIPEEVRNGLRKECERASKIPFGSAELTVIENHNELCLSLPWNVSTTDKTDIKAAERILENDHFGLEKVKERILEYLAVRKLNPELKSQIICLVGPPGTGKTSIASSVARALGRKFVRVSLGGIRDEAEIRGHRKTYIGAMPGRIITAVQKSGVNNPVMLLDEIDKMASDIHGDPCAAMLEVLDSEQNFTFRDHFVEFPFDLSNVFFIATANTLEGVPKPLIDRMEIIRLDIYTRTDKLMIAKKHLIPKQVKRHGLTGNQIRFSDDAIYEIIDYYTREAGVRGLERAIADIARKHARKIESGEAVKRLTLTSSNVRDYLGARKVVPDHLADNDEVGAVTGLAYTEVGGDTLEVEAVVTAGKGHLELTGSLGNVMKESARIALTCARTVADEYGYAPDFTENKDIHIHVPGGAVPKDGPSAGVTMCTAIVSALSGIKVRHDIAMTGELSLRGNVLAIGGLREKSMAAYKAGCDTVIIPNENVKDLDEISAEVKNAVRFVSVKSFDELLPVALVTLPKRKKDVKNNNVVIADNKSKANIVTQ